MYNKPPEFVPYKFKSLKTYGSRESFIEGTRNYKQVFFKEDVDYVWVELAIYNKLFDEEDWELEGKLEAYTYSPSPKEQQRICSINFSRTVSKDINILYVRQGWGNDNKGSFWKAGAYLWKAYIKNPKTNEYEKVGETLFYIIQIPKHIEKKDLFRLLALNLYENGLEKIQNPKYLKQFDISKTRYVNVEMLVENLMVNNKNFFLEALGNHLQVDDPFIPLEFKFLFYSDVGILKGKIDEVLLLRWDKRIHSVDVGWGAAKPGTWGHGEYTLKVYFMDKFLAEKTFVVADSEIEDKSTQNFSSKVSAGFLFGEKKKEQQRKKELEEALKELDSLIGLEKVKQRIREFINYVKYAQLRSQKGVITEEKPNLHFAFLGNPGTGKTTVAKQLGKIFKSLGLLSKGEVIEVGRADLVAEYIGQTAPKVKELLEQNTGNIIFIDEAYSLVRDKNDAKDFGREVIEVLLKYMSEKDDLAIIMAGYPEEMETMLNANPGLKSRIGNIIHFPDYTIEELMEIAITTLDKKNLRITIPALQEIEKHITKAYRNRDKYFGNARFIISLIDSAKLQLASRLSNYANFEELSLDVLSTITEEDVKAIFQKSNKKASHIPIDYSLLEIAFSELKEMIGLENIKEQVSELIDLVKFYQEIGKDVQAEFPLHSVFYGNPGTGKTTVARLLAKIFKALGILERGHLIEADRSKFVAEYLGQTAPKTHKLIDQAIGGVLFIDEAYNLYLGEGDTYGREAIATLLKRMEDQRGEFIVIIAGYQDNIKKFLESNPGLKSRFDNYFFFKDYSPEELLKIAMLMFKKEGVTPNPAATAILKEYIETLVARKDAHFGNARTVRKIVEKVIKNQHLRLAKIPADQRTPEDLKTILPEDVQEFSLGLLGMEEGIQHKAPSIGFKIKRDLSAN